MDIHAGEWKEMKHVNNFEVTKSPVCAPMWGSEQNLKKGGGGLKGFGLYFVLINLQGLKGPRCIVGVRGFVFPF